MDQRDGVRPIAICINRHERVMTQHTHTALIRLPRFSPNASVAAESVDRFNVSSSRSRNSRLFGINRRSDQKEVKIKKHRAPSDWCLFHINLWHCGSFCCLFSFRHKVILSAASTPLQKTKKTWGVFKEPPVTIMSEWRGHCQHCSTLNDHRAHTSHKKTQSAAYFCTCEWVFTFYPAFFLHLLHQGCPICSRGGCGSIPFCLIYPHGVSKIFLKTQMSHSLRVCACR